MTLLRSFVFLSLCAGLSACGTTKTERAVSGSAIGGGVGLVGSAISGGDPLTGAVIGGLTGGVVGVVTDKDDINLGD